MKDEDTTDDAESKPKVEAVREDSGALDLKRQTGDISLYKFYFKSVSWILAIFWLALAVLYTGLSKMPGKFIHANGNISPCIQASVNADNVDRCLDPDMGRAGHEQQS
jgi:hypothetical protein